MTTPHEFTQHLIVTVTRNAEGIGGTLELWMPNQSLTLPIHDAQQPHSLEKDIAASMNPNEISNLIDASDEDLEKLEDFWPLI
jgi:hypothetical protein